nr:ATP-binding protein [uncultured Arsenicibacter sp.]
MRVNKLKIEGVGGIVDLELNFNASMNVLCGPNGIGKTTVLESIAHIFTNGDTSILKRNVNALKSRILAEITIYNIAKGVEIAFDTFVPEKKASIQGLYLQSGFLISLKTTRTFQYSALKTINRDSDKEYTAPLKLDHFTE